jgi:hypothetical protein
VTRIDLCIDCLRIAGVSSDARVLEQSVHGFLSLRKVKNTGRSGNVETREPMHYVVESGMGGSSLRFIPMVDIKQQLPAAIALYMIV